MTMRFHLPPGGDVPPSVAARRLGLTLEAFHEKLPELEAHGFPPARRVTGNYCLEAIDAWRLASYPQTSGNPLTLVQPARDVHGTVRDRLTRIRGSG
jgi:hypothetical protein